MTDDERKTKERARWNTYDALHRNERRAKDKAAYAADPDRYRNKNRAYHAANREVILARQHARRLIKRNADIAARRKWRAANPELAKALAKKRYYSIDPERRRNSTKAWNLKYRTKRVAWREANKTRLATLSAAWARTNSGLKQAAKARRLADKIRATPKWADKHRLKFAYKACADITRDTGIAHEIDHIVPLRSRIVCGLHVPWNLQVLTKIENRRKANRLLI